jgi:hypothetical protein
MHFILDIEAEITGTAWADDVEVAPAVLVQVFGAPPRRADSYKVSGLYSFVDQRGRVFTVYDWKSTSLWERDLPSPLTFWNSRQLQVLSIGSDDEDVAGFREWLLRETSCAGLR